MPQETNKLGILLVVAIAAIVGLALFNGVTDSVSKNTRIYPTNNESITLSSAPATNTTTLAHNNITAVSYFGNTSNNTASLIDTYLNWTTAGVITYDTSNATFSTGMNYNISYTYKPAEYINDSTSRVLIGLLNVFYALAILAVLILGLYKMGLFDLFKRE